MQNTILITRNVNCSELTREQFIDCMKNDLINAVSKYKEIFYPVEFARFQENQKKLKDWKLKEATQYAEKKWKTEKRRNEYITDKLNQVENKPFNFHNISFFDFLVDPLSNGISDNCILRCNEIDDEKIGKCFDFICDNKYFKLASGWQLIDSHNFRPYVKLILSENTENMYKQEEETLFNAMSNFYKNCTYFGD